VTEHVLPEAAALYWRPRVDGRRLRIRQHQWTATTVVHTVPFTGTAVGLVLLNPLAAPVAIACLGHAWVIPELYARRGANVVRPVRRRGSEEAETTALGLLGDLVGHDARELHARTGLVLEPGRLGAWLLGEAGALLVRPGGRTVLCWCVGVRGGDLPPSDRTAHLLLALREDERGFATVANLAFSGAVWRLRRRLDERARPALDAAAEQARDMDGA
jgi:hypothetical protein